MKKISSARLELVADKNGNIVYEPRKVPMIKESLGISERAELARRAMAEPIKYNRPQPMLEVADGLAPARGIAWAIGITALLAAIIGLVILLWV